MTSCPKMIDAGRRKFLSGAGLAAAGMAAATVVPSPAESAPAPARVEYPVEPARQCPRPQAQRAPQRRLSRPGCAGRAAEARQAGADRRRSGRRHRRFLDDLSAQGISAQLQQVRSHPELLRSLLALRLRCGRPADLGPGDAEPPAVHAARSTPTATSTPKASTSFCTAGCPTCSEGGNHGLQASDRPPPDHPEGCEGVQRHLPLLHRRLRLQGLHAGP